MSITSYFKPTCPLPTSQETGIGESATREANDAVKRVLAGQQAKEPAAKKRKVYTEQLAIGEMTIETTSRYTSWLAKQ